MWSVDQLPTAAIETDPTIGIVSLAFVTVLAAVHVIGVRLRALDRIPRSRWLSFGGGVSVAYVFVHFLPELPEGTEAFQESGIVLVGVIEHHIYLVALGGFTAFYGVEQLVSRTRENREPFGVEAPAELVFWVHVGLFTVYNALIGYLVHARTSLLSATLFTGAMALHFLVNDFGLRSAHENRYDEVGRWLLVGSTLLGGVLGVVADVSDLVIAVAISFVGGATILNVVKEELPKGRESRFWAFGVGVVGYSVLLLTV